MCGISGILGPDVPAGSLRRMIDAQRHRGPDDSGIEMLPAGPPGVQMGLGHTRLSILDLSPAGHQPMRDPASGRWVVYNGEIYNHLSLRKELGTRFQSTCDTETLLAAYGRWGRDCVERFRGMFAFAIWDPAEQELFLCRDRLGIKPLYYARVGSRFLFASELRAILETDLVPRKLDRDGLDGFLAFGTVPEPLTIIKDIRLLPAGCWMRSLPDGRDPRASPILVAPVFVLLVAGRLRVAVPPGPRGRTPGNLRRRGRIPADQRRAPGGLPLGRRRFERDRRGPRPTGSPRPPNAHVALHGTGLWGGPLRGAGRRPVQDAPPDAAQSRRRICWRASTTPSRPAISPASTASTPTRSADWQDRRA